MKRKVRNSTKIPFSTYTAIFLPASPASYTHNCSLGPTNFIMPVPGLTKYSR